MSSNVPIKESNITAPTPQNTPLTTAPIAQGLSRPTVPDISEGVEDVLENEKDEDDEDDEEEPTEGAVKQAMMRMVQGRLAELVGKSSGYIENLPVEVKRTVEALKGVQVDYEKLQTEFKRELLQLEEKYLTKYQPLFDRRSDLIHGKAKATAAEIAAGEEVSAKDEEEYTKLPGNPDETAPIPEFWLTALRNHPGISELVTDRDAEALKHLTDIKVTYGAPDSRLGFTLTFYFEANEFFENATLTKSYIYKDEIGYGGDFMYDRAIGSTITWKEDKDLTKEIEIKKQRNKNTNRTRVIRKSRPTDSFFNFFAPPDPPNVDEDDDDVDEEVLEDLEDRLELDYQIGEDIKERIIPRAVDYFTGKALEYDSMAEDFDEDDDDLDDDDDENDLDDDSDDDALPPHARNQPRRAPPKKGGEKVNPDDCKQQ